MSESVTRSPIELSGDSKKIRILSNKTESYKEKEEKTKMKANDIRPKSGGVKLLEN